MASLLSNLFYKLFKKFMKLNVDTDTMTKSMKICNSTQILEVIYLNANVYVKTKSIIKILTKS